MGNRCWDWVVARHFFTVSPQMPWRISRAAMCTDAVPLLEQGVLHAGTAVGFTGHLVDHPDGRKQGAGGHRPLALRSRAPCVIARRRDSEGAAHEPDRIATVVFLDRAVSHWDSLAKNAAARFKKSRSFLSVSFSRLSRVSSSCSVRTSCRVRAWDSTCRCSILKRYSTLPEISSSRAT